MPLTESAQQILDLTSPVKPPPQWLPPPSSSAATTTLIPTSFSAMPPSCSNLQTNIGANMTVALQWPRKYYRFVSGYADELLWAAAWLYKATNNQMYLDYLGNNGDALGGTGWIMTEFGWDVKYAGAQTLVAKFLMQGKGGQFTGEFQKYQQKAEYFLQFVGGLIFRQSRNNLQFVTSASFL